MAVLVFIFFIFVIALIGLYMPSFSAMVQIDMKKVIAYSSISHMNFALMGLFSTNFIAILGAFFMMFAHAIVSSALFCAIGVVYDRYKSRLLIYYNGLVMLMPIFSVFLFFFVLANFGFPCTISFAGEFIIFLGLFLFSKMAVFFSLIGLFFTLVYTLSLYNRLVYGSLKIEFIRFFCDLTRREYFIFLPFVIVALWAGIYPSIILDYVIFDLYF
jgi:NADH-quinone oxidoreductase subunit M